MSYINGLHIRRIRLLPAVNCFFNDPTISSTTRPAPSSIKVSTNPSINPASQPLPPLPIPRRQSHHRRVSCALHHGRLGGASSCLRSSFSLQLHRLAALVPRRRPVVENLVITAVAGPCHSCLMPTTRATMLRSGPRRHWRGPVGRAPAEEFRPAARGSRGTAGACVAWSTFGVIAGMVFIIWESGGGVVPAATVLVVEFCHVTVVEASQTAKAGLRSPRTNKRTRYHSNEKQLLPQQIKYTKTTICNSYLKQRLQDQLKTTVTGTMENQLQEQCKTTVTRTMENNRY